MAGFDACEVDSSALEGGLPYTARISLADGSRKVLGRIEAGAEVLGVDGAGKVVATPVLQTFNHGRAESWLRVRGERLGAGRGSATFSVVCTPNHRFWMPEPGEYVPAGNLAVGQRVTVLRTELDLTPCQSSVLLGKLLGDGYLHLAPSGSGSVVWGHREADRDYVAWTLRALGSLASGTIRTCVSGYGTTMLDARTTFHPCITERFSSMVGGARKAVPEWVADALDPIALAFWYMDDGSLQTMPGQEDRATLSTNSFGEGDCRILIRALERLGVRAELMKDGRGYLTIRLNSDAAERLFLLVAPYVPPSMQRKLPVRYRGHHGWLPPAGEVYKPPLVPQRITGIEHDVSGVAGHRRDIATGTRNFFANGVLVHDSGARAAEGTVA
ncbi:hypothetical protein [Actinoplanes couchii]|uniref:Homing endonuclease LAGLIDADG domain-containing protein n=1 Tax=Actinoplanes couchii TaxID=403638 RepID=A0ABQ3XG97_9ACTN|nr:hypothetical protein [Actinoplanes couchii]MDR6320986.1 hypothetical protein [Actinoplanes couchii]GID57497.1 hypothetical protein Aco03nite_059010 [Actinoplanes couchii]